MYRKLNVKKVIISILIFILLVVSIVVFTLSKVMEHEVSDDLNNSNNSEEIVSTDNNLKTIFKDSGNTISVELDNKYNFVQAHNNEYLIKLSSDNMSDIYISKLEELNGRDLYSVSRADRLAYLESYNSYSNVSDLKELNVNGNQAFTYSFHYLDENLKKAFYIQVVIMKVNDIIYVFDFDFPLDELNFYTNLITETLAEFKVF